MDTWDRRRSLVKNLDRSNFTSDCLIIWLLDHLIAWSSDCCLLRTTVVSDVRVKISVTFQFAIDFQCTKNVVVCALHRSSWLRRGTQDVYDIHVVLIYTCVVGDTRCSWDAAWRPPFSPPIKWSISCPAFSAYPCRIFSRIPHTRNY